MVTLTLVAWYARLCFAAAWAHMGWVDWTEQKIRNRYLALWIKLILAAYGAVALHTLAGLGGLLSVYLLPDYFVSLAGYASLSAAAAAALWWLRVWPAGDVKLFSLLALFYPLLEIPADFRSGLRFLETLINVFVPAAAFLFATASWHLWRTRFSHQKRFFETLGPWRAAPYLLRRSRQALSVARRELAEWARAWRDPRAFLLDALSWLASMAAMSAVSYALNDVVRRPVAKTLLCFGLFFAWSRFCAWLGRGRSLALVLALCGLLLRLHPDVHWGLLAGIFGHISVFSFCIFFGIQIAFKLVAGHAGFLFMPLLFMLPGLIPWGWLAGLGARLWGAAGWVAWAPPTLGLGGAFAGLGMWAGMGLFFGLSLVFVRIWDAESCVTLRPEQISPFMNPGPSLLERLRRDEAYFQDHFSSLYADGLTPEQVRALQAWCRRRRVRQVPLAPTISFANWIFFGYFLTWITRGHVLRFLY